MLDLPRLGLGKQRAADEEIGAAGELDVVHVEPGVHLARDLDELRRVQVEDALRLGMIPAARIVPGHDQYVLQPQRPRGEQVTLERQAVPVTTGLLEDGLAPVAVIEHHARCRQRTQVQRRALVVGDIERVTDRRQFLHARKHRRVVRAVRRCDLARDHELAALQHVPQATHERSFRMLTEPGLSLAE